MIMKIFSKLLSKFQNKLNNNNHGLGMHSRVLSLWPVVECFDA